MSARRSAECVRPRTSTTSGWAAGSGDGIGHPTVQTQPCTGSLLSAYGRSVIRPRYPPAMPKPRQDRPRGHTAHPQDGPRVRPRRASRDRRPAPVRYHSPSSPRSGAGSPRSRGAAADHLRRARGGGEGARRVRRLGGLIELQPHYSWIIDRFHLSARRTSPGARHRRRLRLARGAAPPRWMSTSSCARAATVGGRPRGAGSCRAVRPRTTTSTHSAASRTSSSPHERVRAARPESTWPVATSSPHVSRSPSGWHDRRPVAARGGPAK